MNLHVERTDYNIVGAGLLVIGGFLPIINVRVIGDYSFFLSLDTQLESTIERFS